MEQGYELNLAAIKQAVLEQSNNSDLYIPLHGKHTTNPDEEPFDLAEKIQSFFVFDDASQHDPKVMLLMGDAGSGKSVFSQRLHQQLWRAYKSGNPIPLWIPLPELQNPFEGAVEEVLTKYGFDKRQIAEIKEKEKIIFIVDGYDELHQFQNCYVTNKWHQWNAKVLMTCRSQALYYQKDPDKYFMPFNGEKRLPLLLRRLYVAPFSKEQISAYIKKYQQLNTEHKISEEDFVKVLGLTELINTPFLLHLAVESLPDILADQVDNEKMTQAKLYDVFIERWFTRQIRKLNAARLLKDTEKNTKRQFWSYCKKLALKMHKKKVTLIPYQGQKMSGRLFGKLEQANKWELFFNEDSEILRSACPLKRFGEDNYGFIHASMIEYFATRAMYEEIQVNKPEKILEIIEVKEKSEDSDERQSERQSKSLRGGIHQRLFAQEKNTIRFLADRIEMSEAFKQKMLKILDASKMSQHFAVGAANVITALVKAGATFNGQNLAGIKIPGADISRGYFDSANFSDSDLSNVQMINVWLRDAIFEGANIEDINFGEYPWFKQANSIVCFDYREDLQRLVIVSDYSVSLLDSVTGNQISTLKAHEERVKCIQFSADGKLIASGNDYSTIIISEVASGAVYKTMQGHKSRVNCLAFSHDGKLLISGSGEYGRKDYTIRLWCVEDGLQQAVFEGHTDEVNSVQFSPNTDLVASGSDDWTIRIWDVEARTEIAVLQEHNFSVNCIQFSLDGNHLVSGSGDKTVRIWDVTNKKLIGTLVGHENSVNIVSFNPNGDRVISGSDDKTVRVWDVSTKQALSILRGHQDKINWVQFDQSGKNVISGSDDKTVRIWDITVEGSFVRKQGHANSVRSVQISPDGKKVVSGSNDHTLRIWDAMSGNELTVLRGHENSVNSVAYSPDGKQIVSGSFDKTVRIWNIGNNKNSVILHGHDESVNCVQFSPDGKRIASGSGISFGKDNSVRIWEVSNGKELVVLRGHEDYVKCLAFSVDGKQVVSGGNDATVRVWDVKTGKQIVEVMIHHVPKQVAFSSDGKHVISGGNNTIRSIMIEINDVESGKEIKRFAIEKDQQQDVIGGHFQFLQYEKWILIGTHNTLRIYDIESERGTMTWKFHAEIMDFSYHPNASLVLGFHDHSIECWQINANGLQLRWSTFIDCPNLYIEGLHVRNVMGVTDQNRKMLEQRGAVADTRSASQSNAIIKLIAQRAGSPIHHHQVSLPSQKGGQELIKYSGPELVRQSSSEDEENNNEENEKKGRNRCVIV